MLRKLRERPSEIRFRELLPILTVFFLTLAWGMRNLLALDGDRVFIGDQEQFYALFHHFSLSLRNFQFPLWDPYTDLGVPIFPAMALWRLFDPIDLALTYGLNFLPGSIFTHFHYYVLLKIFSVCLGIAYLQWILLRIFFPRISTAKIYYFLFIQFLTLSYFLRPLLMDSYITTIQFLPLTIAWFLQWLNGARPKYLFLTLFSFGLYIGSASYTCIIGSFIFGLIVLFAAPRILRRIHIAPMENLRAAIAGSICFAGLILPALSNYYESANLVPLARIHRHRELFEHPEIKLENIDYSFAMEEGTKRRPMEIGEFFLLTLPQSFNYSPWGIDLAESILLLALTLGSGASMLFGFLAIRNRYQAGLAGIGVLLCFLILQNHTTVHAFLCRLFPFLLLVRQMSFYLSHLWIVLSSLALGGFSLWAWIAARLPNPAIRAWPWLAGILSLYLVAMNLSPSTYDPFLGERKVYDPYFFDHDPKNFRYPSTHQLFLPRPPWYLLDSLLRQEAVAISSLPDPPKGMTNSAYPLFREWHKYVGPHSAPPAFGLRTFFWSPYYHRNFLRHELDVAGLAEAFEIDHPFADAFPETNCREEKEGYRCERPIVASTGQFKILDFSPNQFDYHLSLPEKGVVVIRDNFHPDWEAFIDGNAAPIYLYRNEFKAVRVPSGEHDVTFMFRPRFFLWSLALYYAITIAGFMAIAYWARRIEAR